MIEIGIKGSAAVICSRKNCAVSVGSGELEVFATPAMTSLMEEAAYRSVAPFLEEGQTTVGTSLNIAHKAATPIGMSIRVESELVEVDGRRLVFDLVAYDECGEIGSGRHERFIVDAARFMCKTESKKNANL